MVKLVVMYGHPEEPEAFEKLLFRNTPSHCCKIQGLSKVEFTKFVGTPEGGNPIHYRMAELYFESFEELQKQMATPEGQAAVNDIPNFATGGVNVMIGEV